MTQSERRIYLIKALLDESDQYRNMEIPSEEQEQRRLLRGLMNIRMPRAISDDFIKIQDEYLQYELNNKGIIDYKSLQPASDGLYLWQGDITTLKCGAIVNAANSGLLGCFAPNHICIDNAIHTYAGVQLRAACNELMQKQGHREETGKAKITPAFNLPCKYVIHTVGPIVHGSLTARDEKLLAACYRSCLEIAEKNGIESIAFCCISTGEFHFPNKRAAEIAVKTVKEYKMKNNSRIDVIFNVFKDVDLEIYENILK